MGWVREQLVVVKFEDEGDFVGVLAGDHPEYAQCGSHGITAPFDGEFDDVFGIKVDGVGGKGRAAGVFDPLIDGENRNVPGAREPSRTVEALQVVEHGNVAVGVCKDPVDKVGTGECEQTFVYQCFVIEQIFGVIAEVVCDFVNAILNSNCHGELLLKN